MGLWDSISSWWSGDEPDPKCQFSDACFLMDYVDVLAAKNWKATAPFPVGYQNFKTVGANSDSGGGSHEIIAKLTSGDGLKIFLNLPPAALSVLQPKIRLYKMIYDNKNDPPVLKEFIFSDFTSKGAVDALGVHGGKKLSRMGGAGLAEASWKFNGTNPAEADRVISVDMKFEFQSAADLLGARYNPMDGNIIATAETDDSANLIDLILHPPSAEDSMNFGATLLRSAGVYLPKFYRVKMVVGWSHPDLPPEGTLPGLTRDETNQLLRELKRMRRSIILNLVTHKFDIKENGNITLEVEYIGALEEAINGNDANILNVEDAVRAKRLLRAAESANESKTRQIEALNEQIECVNIEQGVGNDTTAHLKEQQQAMQEEITEANEIISEITSAAKGRVYKQFLTMCQNRVKGFDIDEDEIEEWLESVDYGKARPDFSDLAGDVETGAPDNAEDAEEAIEEAADEGSGDVGAVDDQVDAAKDAAVDPDKGRIHFIYLGDIIDVACHVMKKELNPSVDGMALMLGPVVIKHLRGGKVHMNLASLPIPYEDFNAFFFETVVRKQLASYPLKQFIMDIFEKLVKNLLMPEECFPKNKEQRQIQIGMNNFVMTSDIAAQCMMFPRVGVVGGYINVSEKSFVFNESIGDDDDDCNVLFIYLNQYTAADLRANEEDDRDKGIYHYYIGTDAGIIKSIEYSRSDVEGLREARQAEARNLGQIRDVYDASVTMVGNSLYIPGMKVFLNPPVGFGRPEADGYMVANSFGSLANMLGIGGYYDVITVESTISRGGAYETTLDCVFAQSGGTVDNQAAKCEDILDTVEGPPEGFLDSLGNLIGL
tara:strand:- start:105 stop:2591 length:2487 start_codon:yes stop_codon:yes gene_type:complete